MKILVIGDSHGNIANLRHVMGFGKFIKADAVIHTGDWSNVKSLMTVFNYNLPLYTVLGNADIDPILIRKLKLLSTEFSEKCLNLMIDDKRICIIHNIKHLKEDASNFDIVFCGHRHRQLKENNIVSPGALENDINFVVFDTLTNSVELINI